MSSGAWIVVAVVVVGLAFGLYRALTDGRFRGTHELNAASTEVSRLGAGAPRTSTTVWDDVLRAIPDAALGEKATLLQFSSAFCAPCRATRRTLSEVAAAVPGVEHLEVDAEHHLDLVRRLGILRTPTTLVLDTAGVEITRAAGAPRKEQVLQALASAT